MKLQFRPAVTSVPSVVKLPFRRIATVALTVCNRGSGCPQPDSRQVAVNVLSFIRLRSAGPVSGFCLSVPVFFSLRLVLLRLLSFPPLPDVLG
ncbi:hypothetical protein [Phocaeicola sartorii]|uniref:hypothetical protein n=1 Tax=Phocaeicola sartorii TaxID=671267 RepID=UPI003F68BF36